MDGRKIILAMETGILGGSLSLFENGRELASSRGNEQVSKSEEILYELSVLLDKNKLAQGDIKKIIISKSPGSFTGLRIGKALALGLKTALDCEVIETSCLDAITVFVEESIKQKRIIAALKFGRSQMSWKEFEVEGVKISSVGEEQTGGFSEFYNLLQGREPAVIINEPVELGDIKDNFPEDQKNIKFIIPEKTLAYALAMYEFQKRAGEIKS